MSLANQEPHAATRRTIWQSLDCITQQYGERDAIIHRGAHVTYAELRHQVNKLAAGLMAAGIEPGDHVAIMFPLIPEWIYLHYALASMGAIIVPVNVNYVGREIQWVLERADVTAVIAADGHGKLNLLEMLRSADPALEAGEVHSERFPAIRRMLVLDSNEDRGGPYSLRTVLAYEPSAAEMDRLEQIRAGQTGGDPCYILFTSGSTARPKSALVSHRAICGVGYYTAGALAVDERDRVLAMLTTFHIGGVVNCIHTPHAVGAASVLIGGYDPAVILETIERERCTATVGFDTMLAKLINHPDFAQRDVSSLKKLVTGSTPAWLDQLQETFKFQVLAALYGCTESGSLSAAIMPEDTAPEIRRNSNGRPLPGLEYRIVDPETGACLPPGTSGEICFRGWSRFLEYYRMPEETAAAIDAEGFCHSGDYGWLDEQGYLYFRGRYKAMVKTGGENVSQREVEIFLEDVIPAVEFAQVVGVPDEVWNEAVIAFVQLHPGRSATPEEIREQCRGKIAGFKIPKHVFVMQAGDWPVLAVGRPDKHTLRKMAMERLGRQEIS